jgi:hypothetical protein
MASDRATGVERVLTWLGAWAAMRWGSALLVSLALSVALCEVLAASAARIFPLVNPTVVAFFALCIGLLIGLPAYYAAPWWDEHLFAPRYGPQGRWRDAAAPVLALFPPGAALDQARGSLLQVLERKPESPAGIDREAVRIARRQAERWEKIERPRILAEAVRACLWPCVLAAGLGLVGTAFSAVLGGREAARLLGIAVGCAMLGALLLIPYCRLQVEYQMRLYHDVVGHAPKKKQAPSHKSEPGAPKRGRPGARPTGLDRD